MVIGTVLINSTAQRPPNPNHKKQKSSLRMLQSGKESPQTKAKKRREGKKKKKKNNIRVQFSCTRPNLPSKARTHQSPEGPKIREPNFHRVGLLKHENFIIDTNIPLTNKYPTIIQLFCIKQNTTFWGNGKGPYLSVFFRESVTSHNYFISKHFTSLRHYVPMQRQVKVFSLQIAPL